MQGYLSSGSVKIEQPIWFQLRRIKIIQCLLTLQLNVLFSENVLKRTGKGFHLVRLLTSVFPDLAF